MNIDNKESYRQIKFRGIAINPFDNWVYGSLLVIKDCETENKTYKILQDGGGQIRVTPESIGQYTGLKDKNGKDIYEGDVVRCGLSDDAEIALIVFKQSSFLLKYLPIEKNEKEQIYDYLEGYRYFKIIGNIHDTPELIKQ